jgi:hypothetical protein
MAKASYRISLLSQSSAAMVLAPGLSDIIIYR